MFRILVGGAGGAPANNFIRSLKASGEFYIIGTTSNKFDLYKSLANESYLIPEARSENYLTSFEKILDRTSPDFVYPSHDFEVEKLSDNRKILESKNVKYFFPKAETVRSCVDKSVTAKIWINSDIKVPDTIIVNNENDLSEHLKKYGKVWLRLKEGGGGYGAVIASSLKFGTEWINFFNGWGNFTAANVLTPRSVTWSSIWKDGELIVAQGRERLSWAYSSRTLSGVTGITGAAKTISNQIVDDVALAAIKAVDPSPNGIFSVDLTYDQSGIPNPTEINIGRFFTTIDFFTRLGLNMPYIFVMIGLGMINNVTLPSKRINPLTPGKCWLRSMDIEPVLMDCSALEAF
ncbi:MAG: hypothetical protein QXU18_14500 [Thermoplasmatales archaeon]